MIEFYNSDDVVLPLGYSTNC